MVREYIPPNDAAFLAWMNNFLTVPKRFSFRVAYRAFGSGMWARLAPKRR